MEKAVRNSDQFENQIYGKNDCGERQNTKEKK